MFGKRGVNTDFRGTAPAEPAAPAQRAAAPLAVAPELESQSASVAPVESGRTPYPTDGLGAPQVPAPTPERC